jgi:hypothetical protein
MGPSSERRSRGSIRADDGALNRIWTTSSGMLTLSTARGPLTRWGNVRAEPTESEGAPMLQRLLDRFVPVRDDDSSWLDHRDGVGVPAAVAGSSHPASAIEAAGERTLQH